MQDFKANGILYFFATVNREGEHHNFKDIIVRYLEQTGDLKETDLPVDIQEYGVFAEKGLVTREEIDAPSDESSLFKAEEMSEEEEDCYFEITNLLQFYNSNYQATLLRHTSQLDESVFLNTYLDDSKITYKDWCDADGRSDEKNSKQ